MSSQVRILLSPHFGISRIAGVAQLVERQPSKLNVAGSNPVSRSKKRKYRSFDKLNGKLLLGMEHIALNLPDVRRALNLLKADVAQG